MCAKYDLHCCKLHHFISTRLSFSSALDRLLVLKGLTIWFASPCPSLSAIVLQTDNEYVVTDGAAFSASCIVTLHASTHIVAIVAKKPSKVIHELAHLTWHPHECLQCHLCLIWLVCTKIYRSLHDNRFGCDSLSVWCAIECWYHGYFNKVSSHTLLNGFLLHRRS